MIQTGATAVHHEWRTTMKLRQGLKSTAITAGYETTTTITTISHAVKPQKPQFKWQSTKHNTAGWMAIKRMRQTRVFRLQTSKRHTNPLRRPAYTRNNLRREDDAFFQFFDASERNKLSPVFNKSTRLINLMELTLSGLYFSVFPTRQDN